MYFWRVYSVEWNFIGGTLSNQWRNTSNQCEILGEYEMNYRIYTNSSREKFAENLVQLLFEGDY